MPRECSLCFQTTAADTLPIRLDRLSNAGGLTVGLSEAQRARLYAMVCGNCRNKYMEDADD